MSKDALSATGLYTALESFTTKDAGSPGGVLQYRRGDRLLGNHAVVVAHSRLFAEDGLDEPNMVALRNTLAASGGDSP